MATLTMIGLLLMPNPGEHRPLKPYPPLPGVPMIISNYDWDNSGEPIIIAKLSQYAEAPSRDTLDYRQYTTGEIPMHLPDNVVLMATADCSLIGNWGVISINGGAWEPMVVFDCAGHESTYRWMINNNIIGEIDYYSAFRHEAVCRCLIDGRVIWLN